MILKFMELKNYTRLYVGGIKKISYRPVNKLQIIIGTNGHGKSSLLKEVLPNVEELNKDYEKDGYKITEYLHNNKKYVLTYNRNTNKHSFQIDEIEYNQSGLKKIQKELIEEHFRLNKYIHELLLGTTQFSNMSVSERKKWFTNILVSIDYTYALNKYNKVKQRISDLKSYIKLTESKIHNIDVELKEYEDIEKKQLINNLEIIDNFIYDLLSKKPNIKHMEKPNINEINNLKKKLNALISKTNNVTEESVISELGNIEHKIKIINYKIKDIDEKLNELHNKKLSTLTTEERNKIEKEYNKIKNRLDKIKSILGISSIYELPYHLETFKNNYNTFIDIVSELTEYDKINLNKDHREQLNKNIEVLTEQLTKLETKIKDIDKEYSKQLDYQEQEEVRCPKCSYAFKPNFDPKLLEKYRNELNDLFKSREELSNKLNKLLEEQTKLNTKLELTRELVNYFKQFPNLLNILLDKTDKFYNTDILTNIISNFNIKLPDYQDINNEIDNLKQLEKQLEVIKTMSINKINELNESFDKYSRQRIEYIKEKNQLTEKFYRLKQKLNIYKSIKELRTELTNKLKYLFKFKNNFLLKVEDEFINKVINETKLIKHEIQTKLDNMNNLYNNKKQLQEDLNNFKEELEAYKWLEEQLSPTKGLIAKSLMSTIEIVLERMNQILNDIWTYPIEIEPPNIEDRDLDFKFPVIINKSKRIPDVSKGSSSIREVIDLAFKITAMEFLDMYDYPLILDEFARTMDETHRIKAYDYIEKITRDRFSQVYIVAHYESIFNRFKNTDVILLDDKNVNYTGTYNEVIKIEKE